MSLEWLKFERRYTVSRSLATGRTFGRIWFPKINPLTIISGLIFGAIIHILAIFMLPYVSERNAWAQIAQHLPANELQLLPLATPSNQVLPFMAPDVHYAMCRYDLTDGPVSVRIPEFGQLWSVGLYDQLSHNFFVVTGNDLQRNNIELLLNRPKSKDATFEPAPQGGKEQGRTITVRVPENEGLVVIRAPIENVSDAPLTDAAIRQAGCRLAT